MTALGATRTLATWAASVTPEEIPQQAERVLREALLDTLGCGLFGLDQPWSRMARQWCARGSYGRATYWGTRDKGRASDVAFANGISAHAFELDDYHPVKVHPGAVVIPAALAVAEDTNASAQDVLAAIAVGYEVMIRTSAALDPSVGRLRGWHLTGVTGTFGAAAAAGRLLGLDAERMSWAFGLAGTQSSGLFAFNADGAMSKRFHAGHAARGGVVAAEMAQLGFTGPTSIYETEDGGFLRAFSDASSPEPLVHALGEDWRLFDIAFKPYSCCGSLHAYIDAARALRDEFGFADGSEQRVRIGLPKVVEVQCGFDYEEPTSLGAQMNARFCVASALRYGNVLPAQFETERLADPETLRIMDRVEQVHDASLDDIYPAQFCAWVELQDADGSYRREYRAEPSGWASNPERSDVLRAKFSSLMSDRLASATQQALTDWVEEVTVRPVARANSTLRVAELVGLLDVGERVPGDERTGQG